MKKRRASRVLLWAAVWVTAAGGYCLMAESVRAVRAAADIMMGLQRDYTVVDSCLSGFINGPASRSVGQP